LVLFGFGTGADSSGACASGQIIKKLTPALFEKAEAGFAIHVVEPMKPTGMATFDVFAFIS